MVATEQLALLPAQGMDLAPSDLYHMSQIMPPPGPAPDKAFRASVARYKVLVPIIIQAIPQPVSGESVYYYRIVDGRRRFLSAVEAGHDFIPGQLLNNDEPISPAMVTIITNEQRSRNPIAELEAIKDMMRHGMSEQGMTLHLGIASATLKKRMRLMQAPDIVLNAVSEGQMPVSTAEQIATMPRAVRDRIAARVEDGEKITQDIVAQERRAGMAKSLGGLTQTIMDGIDDDDEQEPESFPENVPGADPVAYVETMARNVAKLAIAADVSQRRVYEFIRDEWNQSQKGKRA